MGEAEYLVGLNLLPGMGPSAIERALAAFGSARGAWEASAEDLARAAGLKRGSGELISRAKASGVLEREIAIAEAMGAYFVTKADSIYPPSLREVPATPPVLYVLGTLPGRDSTAVAVVGTRRASSYGLSVAYGLARDLARCGVVVVSGLARGIDAMAHRGSLDGGGPTVAVLGSGLDVIYPPEHRKLYRMISEAGAVVSEFPFGTRPARWTFPRRNRLIAGASSGCIVVESGEDGGALITAGFALEFGREVMAVPGDITRSTSKGTNRLIRDGAVPVTELCDVLDALGLSGVMTGQERACHAFGGREFTREEGMVLEQASEGADLEEIAVRTGLGTFEVSRILTKLEVMGIVQRAPGMRFVVVR